MGIRSKERSEHTFLLLLARGLNGNMPFDHHSWRWLSEHFCEGRHSRELVKAVAAGLRQQALGMRHPGVCWQWEISFSELCEHAGLCLPVLAHTEKNEAQSVALKGFHPVSAIAIEQVEVFLHVKIDGISDRKSVV